MFWEILHSSANKEKVDEIFDLLREEKISEEEAKDMVLKLIKDASRKASSKAKRRARRKYKKQPKDRKRKMIPFSVE